MHSNKPKNSEVDAYTYIKEELEKLGWNVKNPARVLTGEVYKQNEVLANNEIKKYFDRDMPEAVVKLNEKEYWVIESKRDKKDIDTALNEAIDQYAKKINQSSKIKCVIASGVAGNDTDGYKVINELDPAASRGVSGRVANREVSAPPTTLQTPSSPWQATGFSELRYKKFHTYMCGIFYWAG